MSIINELGVLAISTRLQKLSDSLRKDCSLIYKQNGIDFEAKWFPAVYILSKKGPLTVMELAAEMGYAHPSVITLVKELELKKLVKSTLDKNDGRKRVLSLTPKTVKMIDEMQPVWNKMIAAVNDLLDTKNNLMKAIDEVEKKLAERSLCERLSEKRKVKNEK